MAKTSDLFNAIALAGVAIIKGTEPASFAKVRSRIAVYSPSYGGGYLEWYKLLAIVGDTDQMTVTYALPFAGRGMEGDIEAFAQIYNPENTWRRQSFHEVIIEITRMGWNGLDIKADGQRYIFPSVFSDGVVTEGYVTFRMPL